MRIKEYKNKLIKFLIEEIIFHNNTVGSILPDKYIGNNDEITKLYLALNQVADNLEGK